MSKRYSQSQGYVSQGSILRLVLFNVSINVMDSGVEGSLSKSVDDKQARRCSGFA